MKAVGVGIVLFICGLFTYPTLAQNDDARCDNALDTQDVLLDLQALAGIEDAAACRLTWYPPDGSPGIDYITQSQLQTATVQWYASVGADPPLD